MVTSGTSPRSSVAGDGRKKARTLRLCTIPPISSASNVPTFFRSFCSISICRTSRSVTTMCVASAVSIAPSMEDSIRRMPLHASTRSALQPRWSPNRCISAISSSP